MERHQVPYIHTKTQKKVAIFADVCPPPLPLLGSVCAFHTSGSFTGVTFADVIRHIIANTPQGKKLLIIDGHNSHHDVTALEL